MTPIFYRGLNEKILRASGRWAFSAAGHRMHSSCGSLVICLHGPEYQARRMKLSLRQQKKIQKYFGYCATCSLRTVCYDEEAYKKHVIYSFKLVKYNYLDFQHRQYPNYFEVVYSFFTSYVADDVTYIFGIRGLDRFDKDRKLSVSFHDLNLYKI